MAGLLAGLLAASIVQAQTGTAVVQHAPTINGTIEGSLRLLTADDVTFNGGAKVSGSLYIPGTPTITLKGNPSYGGTLDGTGAPTPTNHKVTLNGGASLGHVVRRTDSITLPTVTAPP
ncbi:MAG: hypothetical protein ACOZE5_12725, partial [Verrucomicrobiota bacterium]